MINNLNKYKKNSFTKFHYLCFLKEDFKRGDYNYSYLEICALHPTSGDKVLTLECFYKRLFSSGTMVFKENGFKHFFYNFYVNNRCQIVASHKPWGS